MEEVRPRVDRFLTDVQPRLDSVLRRVESRIADLRRDLEERAARNAATQPPSRGAAAPRRNGSGDEPAA
jgi:hypothetical protein